MFLLLHFVVVDEFIILVEKRKQNISASESSSRHVTSKTPKKHITPNPKNGLHYVVLIHESRTELDALLISSQ